MMTLSQLLAHWQPPGMQNLETFPPVGVPGCKPGATLVPETRVATAQHVYNFQAEPVPTSPAVSS